MAEKVDMFGKVSWLIKSFMPGKVLMSDRMGHGW